MQHRHLLLSALHPAIREREREEAIDVRGILLERALVHFSGALQMLELLQYRRKILRRFPMTRLQLERLAVCLRSVRDAAELALDVAQAHMRIGIPRVEFYRPAQEIERGERRSLTVAPDGQVAQPLRIALACLLLRRFRPKRRRRARRTGADQQAIYVRSAFPAKLHLHDFDDFEAGVTERLARVPLGVAIPAMWLNAIAFGRVLIVERVLQREDEPSARPQRAAGGAQHFAEIPEVHQRVR